MEFSYKKLRRDEQFEKRIEITCAMNSAKCEFIQGKIIDVNKTNISFIEPHRINITIKSHKLLIIYFNKDNLFLYDRTMPITVKKLVVLLKAISTGEYNV